MIKGERVALDAPNEMSVGLIWKWHEDDDFDFAMSDEVGPKSILDIQAQYGQFLAPHGRLFMGMVKPISVMSADEVKKLDEAHQAQAETWTPIGVIGIRNIDAKNRTAELVGGIGFRSMREKGLGIESSKLLIKWARAELGLHRIYAYCRESNQMAINTLKTAGFTLETSMKDALFHDGRFCNKILLAHTKPIE